MVSSTSSSYYQKNELFEECLRGSETKQRSSIILVCFTLSLTALIIWFLRMQCAMVEFSIWLDKHKGGRDIKLPSTEIPLGTTRIYCCVHPALWGAGNSNQNFGLLGFPVCSVTQTFRSRQGGSWNLRAMSWIYCSKCGAYSQLQSEEVNGINADFIDRCLLPLNQERFCHSLFYAAGICVRCTLTALIRPSRREISGRQKNVLWQRRAVLLSQESPKPTCLWCL